MNFKNSIRIVLWGGLVVIIFWLVWQDRVPSGKLTLIQDFKHQQLYFDDFRPGERLIPYQHDGDKTYHRLIGSPIYFHLRTPRPFDRDTFDITYRTTSTLPFQFGGQTGPLLSDFSYQTIPVIADNVWHTIPITFDLTKLRYHPTERRYQFSFQTTAPIDIAKISSHFMDTH